jgi:hypothetical protein
METGNNSSLGSTTTGFKRMKIVSHRSAPQVTEVIIDFSVFCGDLCGYSSI